MDAQRFIVPLLVHFRSCFTKPGFAHFEQLMRAHMALLGLPHCVTEVLRLTRWHELKHWTSMYAFLSRGRFSCRRLSQCLLELILLQLGCPKELVVAIDDTLVKKGGRRLFGLGLYRDPADKNPGAHRRRVYGHCWVVLALLWPDGQRWRSLGLAARLFVPQKVCPKGFTFQTKIDLAVALLHSLRWPVERLVLVVDNLYAKASLAQLALNEGLETVLISRLRSNAALYELPPPKHPGQRGAPRKRGAKVNARQLYRRHSKRQPLRVHIYGKTVTIEAFVDVLIPSRTLGAMPILVVIFPQRSGKKMNIFFSTDLTLDPVRLLELYGARFQIEQLFAEIKTHGGFSDCRQRGFTAIRRHATLVLLAHSLLQLFALACRELNTIAVEPWWAPKGTPSVTRLRRAALQAMNISSILPNQAKVNKNERLKHAA